MIAPARCARCTRTALALLLLPWTATAQENLVANPGFEEIPASGEAASWPAPKYVGAEFRIDDEVAHSGRRSARVDGTDPAQQSNYVQAWRQDLGPLPKEELWLSVWVKADGITGARVNVLHRDKDGQVLLNQTVRNLEGTFDWQEIAGTLERVEGAVSLQLVMGLTKSPGTVCFMMPTARREVESCVIGTGPISRVDLVRNNEVVLSQAGKGALDLSGNFAYLDPLAGTEWYYLRVVQEDTEMAWSSPVWLDPA